ncbi:ATP-binding protein [Nonomuraea sp. CA-141351]|uniref:ATP-binding protein n=1 Tax=Nonomuraea sp. CA-141351 TaxID=3239996 RepID=UPI003D8D58D2
MRTLSAVHFNTTGPCDPRRHYMLRPTPQLQQVRKLIERDRYFVLHAPRQTGKTTILDTLASDLTAEGDIVALSFSCERAKVFSDDIAATEAILLDSLRETADLSGWPDELLPPDSWPEGQAGTRFGKALSEWCRRCPRRVVLFLDDFDALQGTSLISILGQLRHGYNARHKGHPFPASMVLCGLRDLRDYKVASGSDPARLSPASSFNILADSLRLGDFTTDQIAELYDQHTQATGQEFTKDTVNRVFEQTQGQPWLVNALAHEITSEMGVSGTITTAQVDEAKERLIRKRPVHLDALMTRLYEPRVERVIRAIMEGTLPGTDVPCDDDVSYVRNLGLIRGTGAPEIANPIYRQSLLHHSPLCADLLRREQQGPFTDEALAEARLRIFGSSGQSGGRM